MGKSAPSKLPSLTAEDAVVALAALAQPSRLAIFRLLVVAGNEGMSVGKIGEELSLPSATLSFHMKELSHARLIQGTQDGKFVFYRARFEQMNGLLSYLVEHCCDGSDESCVLSLPLCVAETVQRRTTKRKRATPARVA